MNVFFAVLAAAILSCNTVATMPDVHLKLTTDGGFTGRGVGAITVDASKATTERCTSSLTREELQQLGDAIAAAKKSAWKDSYGNAHPDAVQWTMEVDDRKAVWYDSSDVPKEIGALRDAAWKVRERVNRECK